MMSYCAMHQPASDVSEKFGRMFLRRLLVRSVQARRMTELIPTVKMETRHPVEGLLSNEFPSICNHCGVMAA